MSRIESKLPGVGTTIFTVMSRLAEETGAINLSQGFLDYQPPQRLLDLVTKHLNLRHNQYPPMMGIAPLRQAIAAKVDALYGASFDPETEVTVTSGATEAVFCAVHAVVRAGDEVIVLDPAYDCYDRAVTLAGARTIHVPPQLTIDWTRLQQALGPRTRMIVINSPHNPTGTLIERKDLDRIAELIADLDCYVLSDEVYEHIVFDGQPHASVATHPRLRDRSIAAFSFGKTCHATGWKIAYCVAPADLTAEFRRVHQFNTFTTVTPMQHALAEFVAAVPEHHLGLAAFYQQKRDFFVEAMRASRFELLPSRGTYFQLADYSAIADEPDDVFSRWLTETHKLAVIPISVFYETAPDTRIVRFCFAKENATRAEAAQRLAAL